MLKGPVPEIEGLLDWRWPGCLPACGGLPAPAYLDSRPPCGLVACPDLPRGLLGPENDLVRLLYLVGFHTY
jgi:hypothetical protein